MRFSIHFDANSEEFNQLVQTGYLNLARHPVLLPLKPPFIPLVQPNDLQPHPSITGIPDHPHLQVHPPVNDGWNDPPLNLPSGIGH